MDENVLRGKRVGPWTKIPDRLIDSANVLGLDCYQRLIVWAIMANYPDAKLSLTRLSEQCGIAHKTVRAAVHALTRRNLMTAIPMPGGSSHYDLTPLLAELERIPVPDNANFVLPAEPKERHVVEAPPQPHPDDIRYAPTADDYQKSEATLRAMADAQARADAVPSGVKLSPSDLKPEDLQRRIAEVRGRVGRVYYPSLGERECEERLHDMLHVYYDLAEDSTHDEIWMSIEDTYMNFLRDRARAAGYDGIREYARITSAYGRYQEAHDERKGHALSFEDFIQAFYGRNEFHEYIDADL